MATLRDEDPHERIIGPLPDAAGQIGPYGGRFVRSDNSRTCQGISPLDAHSNGSTQLK